MLNRPIGRISRPLLMVWTDSAKIIEGCKKSPITVHKNVGLVIGLLCSIGCDRRNNEVGRIAVCGVVLHHDHRADTALLGAKVRLQIGVVNITAQKFSVDWDHVHHRLQGKLWVRPAPL